VFGNHVTGSTPRTPQNVSSGSDSQHSARPGLLPIAGPSMGGAAFQTLSIAVCLSVSRSSRRLPVLPLKFRPFCCYAQVPIGAADDVSADWMQRAFCTIHHPLCPHALRLAANGRDRTECIGNSTSEAGVADAVANEHRTPEESKDTQPEARQRPDSIEGASDEKGSGREAYSRAIGASGDTGKACAECPEELLEIHVTVADCESSVLVYRLGRNL